MIVAAQTFDVLKTNISPRSVASKANMLIYISCSLFFSMSDDQLHIVDHSLVENMGFQSKCLLESIFTLKRKRTKLCLVIM